MLGRGRDRSIADFGKVFVPDEAAEPILAPGVRGALLELLQEIWAEKELKAVGISPRRKWMFAGPPGGGKTTLAHHLAARLGLPMVAVEPDRLIDSYLGSTGQNIGALFRAAREGIDGAPIVLFLDEFDAVAMKRKAARSSAGDEQNGWINTLLQKLERYDGFVIAATNHADRIDPAIWRRFEFHVTLDLPGQGEREKILARYLAPFGLPRAGLTALARSLDSASPALMRQLCENVKRQIIVGPKLKADMARGAVFARVLASFEPHPDCGKPRLWSLGVKDPALNEIPWPLPLAKDVVDRVPEAEAAPDDVVVKFTREKAP